MAAQSKDQVYVNALPEEGLKVSEHFSSLLLSGDVGITLLELATLGGLTGVAFYLPAERVNVAGSMTLKQLSAFFWTKAVVTRLYNTYCEAVYFAFPQFRTQPTKEHALRGQGKDLCGRKKEELANIHFHDKLTMLSQFVLNVGAYYLLPGYYPKSDVVHPWPERIWRLLANHYILSFGMYWMHRSLHVVPIMWDKIHSWHHWAKHPLSRNTYQDHWFDNFCNAIVGHGFGTVLVPLDYSTFWFSQFLRVFESLEKHSGTSCSLNVAHSLQRFFPFAQMPHHHDWHHEGHKSSNYTFTAIGGLWDCLFGTRVAGRGLEANGAQFATSRDKAQGKKAPRGKALLDMPVFAMTPVVSVGVLVALKLASGQGAVKLRW